MTFSNKQTKNPILVVYFPWSGGSRVADMVVHVHQHLLVSSHRAWDRCEVPVFSPLLPPCKYFIMLSSPPLPLLPLPPPPFRSPLYSG